MQSHRPPGGNPESSGFLGRELSHEDRLKFRRKLAAEARAIFGEVGSGSLACSLTDDMTYGDRCFRALKESATSKKFKG